MPDFGDKKAYRPLWQDTPGYKTLVDQDSQMGIFPAQTESDSVDRGQSNLDSTWPVQLPQSREKQRALPLPSNHDKKREKRIGPTNYNKPRKVPYRTLSVPGEDYGHPTKYDYNYVTRRPGVTALDEDALEMGDAGDDRFAQILADLKDLFTEPPEDESFEPTAGIFPGKRQKSQGNVGRLRSKKWYMRNPSKKRKGRLKYRTIGKRDPREKLKRKYRRQYPQKYTRRGIDPRTPAQKAKEWRRKNNLQKEAAMDLLAEVMEVLGSNWPSNWNTTVKQTVPPEQLDQNFGKGQSQTPGSPRKDNFKQDGESLRAPDLSSKKQKGLKWELQPPASGGLDYPVVTTMNPTDGSGKVLPMSYYTDFANNTQALPDSRQENFLHNNNFDVKVGHQRVAVTLSALLKRCDKKIKQRSKNYTPKLARTDTKNWIWHWKVGDYNVKVQAFKRGQAKSFTKVNLKVSCSCPFWRWWGPEHWGTREDYQKGPLKGTGAYPKVRDPAHWRPVCKHAYAVLEKSQRFFVRPSKSPLKKLGSRFSVDSLAEIEVEAVGCEMTARVAQTFYEQQLSRQVLRRYLDKETL